MDLTFFNLVACSGIWNTEDKYTCTDYLADAMPLFKTIVPYDNGEYQKIIDDTGLQWNGIERNHIFGGPRIEHQYIIDLANISDPSKANEYKKILAITSGSIRYWNDRELVDNGWDVGSIFNDRPREALELVPNIYVDVNSGLREPHWLTYWRPYYRQDIPLDIRFFYFNFSSLAMENLIKSLISCHIKEPLAKVFHGDPLPTNWVDLHYSLFKDSGQQIPVNGGDIIGEVDFNVEESEEPIYRLSMHYLDNGSETDYSEHLKDFMKYRNRIPPTPLIDPAVKTPQFTGSLMGHPIMTKHTEIPTQLSGVDFVDTQVFANKSTASLSLDMESNPINMTIRRRPSDIQQPLLQQLGIDLFASEANQFRVYNPTGQYLKVIVDPSSSPIQLAENQISNFEREKYVKVIPDENTTSAQLQVVLTDPSFTSTILVLHELNLTFLPCKIVPVSFWKLVDLPNSHQPSPFNLQQLLSYANRILGEQCNVYLHTDFTLIDIQVLTSSNKMLDANMVLDEVLPYLDEHATNKCNVMFTWNLNPIGPIDEAGLTYPTLPPLSYPFIFVESLTDLTDDQKGIILAHEVAHWLTLYGTHYNIPESSEISFDHNPGGDDDNMFNVMQPHTSDESICFTTSQRAMLNTLADLPS